jgi:hypothetical protein
MNKLIIQNSLNSLINGVEDCKKCIAFSKYKNAEKVLKDYMENNLITKIEYGENLELLNNVYLSHMQGKRSCKNCE